MTPIEEVIVNKKTSLNPIWIMRQAGRYLSEFREIRKSNPDFIKLCLNSKLAAEITLQPLKRFNLDAAIIFSDILILPYGCNQKVEFKKNFGPMLGDLNLDDLSKLTESDFTSKISPVYEAINLVKNDKLKNIRDREFDVLFCLRYVMNNNHYSLRKRYNFIIQLSNILAKSKFKVCIMGDGWNQIRSHINKEVFLLSPPFKDYGLIYQNSKIYCNPSLVEGGPISLAEAFSSGCIICTTPVGLSFNLCIDDYLSFFMPFDQEVNFWYEKISNLIEKSYNYKNYKYFVNSRKSKIKNITFKNLSSKLEKTLFDIN